MKSSNSFLNTYAIPIILGAFVLLSFFLNVYLNHVICLNADEAAFGYNAYSILQTGRDEYGSFLPLRLTSFADNKLPVLSYAMIPFIALFGLEPWAIRLPTMIAGSLLPVLMYLLGLKLFTDKKTALTAAFLSSVSLGIHIFSRQSFEGVLAVAFIMISIYYALVYLKEKRLSQVVIFSVFVGISLFSYHLAKVIVGVILLWFGYQLLRAGLKKLKYTHVLIIAVPLVLFFMTELMYPASRVSNLLFYKTPGFVLEIEELRREHDMRLVHNKATNAIITLTNHYVTYLSPQFLVMEGDSDPRFGYEHMTPITIVEYVFLFMGFFFLFKNKHPYRYFLSLLFFTSPISAALTWLDPSLKRSLFILIPIFYISAYGLVQFITSFEKRLQLALMGVIGLIFCFFLFHAWDFYYHHYPKRPLATAALQCGYAELNTYIRENYDAFDRFVITRKHGQPYIFTLFYLAYPPKRYQAEAALSPVDEYGFGQVEQFDTFRFNFSPPDRANEERTAYIGYPDDFSGTGIDQSHVQQIRVNDHDVFWIYEDR